jgi:hypothetical protein
MLFTSDSEIRSMISRSVRDNSRTYLARPHLTVTGVEELVVVPLPSCP